MASKNTFEVYDDVVHVFRKEWEKIAFASFREDYYPELSSVTWSVNGEYLHNAKLGYLHRYIVGKWYGEDMLAEMTKAGWIVDHMNNNGFDCQISNLAFLSSDENKAKGFTVDKQSEALRYHIALNLFRDFSTGLYQITIFFNDEVAMINTETGETFPVSLIKLLYDSDYKLVINDARDILLNYELNKSFYLSKLHHKEFRYEKAIFVDLKPEERGCAMEERDGTVMLVMNEHTKMVKVNYDKGWKPDHSS